LEALREINRVNCGKLKDHDVDTLIKEWEKDLARLCPIFSQTD
jgi:hypothetical protein